MLLLSEKKKKNTSQSPRFLQIFDQMRPNNRLPASSTNRLAARAVLAEARTTEDIIKVPVI